MQTSPDTSVFENLYAQGTAGWVIGEPQPAIVELERAGAVRGSVLDAGCGAGEHTIYLARLGYDVLGVDFAPAAVELARANAAERDVPARFQASDIFQLDGVRRFDTIVDSALFHVFGPADRRRYADTLHRLSRPGAVVHVLALSDVEPGIGPRISDSAIREAFSDGWVLEDLRPSTYRGIAYGDAATQLGLEPGTSVETAAWLARARRF